MKTRRHRFAFARIFFAASAALLVCAGGSATAAPKPPPPPPATTTTTAPTIIATNNLLQNSSLETGSSTTPDCWLLGGYGTNSYSWARTTASPHSGQYAEQLNVTHYSNGDRKLLAATNGRCSPATTQGHVYKVTVWYKSSAQPVIFAFTAKAPAGPYGWWAQSPRLPSSSSWTVATWTTPAVPAGVTNLSVGLGLQMGGSVTIDDLSLTDNSAGPVLDTTPPSVSLTAPASGATLTGSVTLSANAADNVAVDHVEFLVDGTKIGSVSSGPYQLSVDSTGVSDGAHTIGARAVDSSGNANTSAAVAVTVANAVAPPPTGGTFTTLASGAAGLPRTTCASQVTTSTWEPVPANATANHIVPAGPVPWSNAELGLYWTKWIAKRNLVTGNYTGTTNQIIQWSACKWGMGEDLMRAVAVQESDWRESMVGDNCGRTGQASYGLFQIKNAYCSGADAWGGYPYSATYTALNADFYGAYLRSCLDGDFYAAGNSWLYNGQSMSQIIAAKGLDYAVWGCVGSWFSGGWYDSGAQNYINGVKSHLANKDWLKY